MMQVLMHAAVRRLVEILRPRGLGDVLPLGLLISLRYRRGVANY
jgi:hypothetical protein